MPPAKVRDDARSMTGPEKAATLLMSLGDEYAARILEHMSEDEIREISQTMATLGSVSSNVVERLFVEFSEQMSSTGSLLGTVESTQRLLLKVMDKSRADAIMEEISGPAGRTMWDKLGNVNETVLAAYLKNEYPQTVAVVLTKVKPDHAARVLGVLPETFAMEVVMRMLRMETVQKDVLEDVERTLRTEFMSNLAKTNKRDPHEAMAEIFNSFDRQSESRFVAALEERSQESADKIKSLMFTFEDLLKIDAGGIQRIIGTVDKSKLPVALKGASDTLKDLFFSNMSERQAKLVRDDIASLGPVRLKDVDEAQTHVVTTAKDLAGRGEIQISQGREEDELVY